MNPTPLKLLALSAVKSTPLKLLALSAVKLVPSKLLALKAQLDVPYIDPEKPPLELIIPFTSRLPKIPADPVNGNPSPVPPLPP